MNLSKEILILPFILSGILTGFSQNQKFVATHTVNGKQVTDTVVIKDTSLLKELNEMMTNPNYKPAPEKFDTVYDKTGLPTIVKLPDTIYGASYEKLEFDSLRNLIRKTGYNHSGTIRPYLEDIAIETYKYDSRRNKVEIRYFGADKKPLRTELTGPAVIRFIYDDKNREAEEQFFDENEKPLPDFAKVIFRYDSKGRLISEEHFDGSGKKIK